MKIRFYPFMPVAASGTRITDADGNEYLDLIAAAGVAAAGYGHPHIRQAIVDQLDTLPTAMHCCHPTTPAVELAERLCELVPGDFPKKAWFGATGSDANDCVFRPPADGHRAAAARLLRRLLPRADDGLRRSSPATRRRPP